MADAKIVLSAVDQTKAAFDSAKRNMQGLSDQVGALPARFGAIGVAISAAFSAATLMGMIKVLDELDAMSERTGIAVGRLSELRAAAALSDTSMEALGVGLRKLSVNMASALGGDKGASAKFDALGITPEQLATFKTADELFVALADKFKTYEDGATKNALATETFGKRGEELIGMLNRGSKSLNDVSIEARQLGAVFSGELAKAASDFNDNLERMKLASEGVKAALLEDILPSLVKVTSELIEGRKAFGGYLAAMVEIGLKTNPFDTWSDGAKKASTDVQRLATEIERLKSGKRSVQELGGGAAIVGPSGAMKEGTSAIRIKTLENELAVANKRKTYFDSLIFKSTEAEANRLEGFGYSKKQAPVVLKKDGTAGDAELKKYISALQNLEQQLGSLNKQTEVEKTTYQATQGSLKDLTKEHKNNLIAKAAEIDKRRANIEVLDAEQARFTALFEVMSRGTDIQREAVLSVRAQIEQYQFETSLIGKTAEQQSLLNAERKIELQTRQQLKAAAENAGDDNRQYEKDAKAIEAAAKQLREGLIPEIKERIRLERDWATGANAALNDYVDGVGNAAAQSQKLFTDAFAGMEDALVNFVKTGKLDFSSLANSIISDLIRIQIRQSVTGPLSGAINSAGGMGGLLSGAKSLFGFADGGIMSGGGPLPLHKYASGGIANTPQLAIFGEGRMNEAFVPLPDGRRIPVDMRGGGGGGMVVNQNFAINATNASAETVGQIRALMPALLAENRRAVEGIVQQSANRRGGRL